jgi:chromosome segregation ATPase
MDNLLHTGPHTNDSLFPGGFFAPVDDSVRHALARAEEARSDERGARLAAEATAEQLATLIAQEHRQLAEERAAREQAEVALARAQRTASEMANLVAKHQARAEEAEERARQAFCAYLDDPFRAPEAPGSRGKGVRAKLRRSR